MRRGPISIVCSGLTRQAPSDTAFREVSPLALHEGATILKPEVAALLRAAYDPVMPVAAQDPSHALRLFARVGAAQ